MTSHDINTKEESSNRDHNEKTCQVDSDGYWCLNLEADSKLNLKDQSNDTFSSCIKPLIRTFQENLVKEATCMEKLQNVCFLLQKENYFLKQEIDGLKDFTLTLKLEQLASYKRELAMLHNKVQILEAALKMELLKSSEYKKEANDMRHILTRETRKKVKRGQTFEVVIAQKPQEVALASSAIPLDENVESCPICLEQFDVVSGWYTLNCGHRYHLLCLAKVLPTRARCCVCNKDIHKILYEIFGLASSYPEDARLWDAQTGHPVDFTIEEDIRAILEELERNEEIADDDDEAHEDSNVQGENNEEETISSSDNFINDEENDLDEENGLEEGEDDQLDAESYVESYHTSSSDEEEQDDPNDPNYEPSSDIHGR